jgi:hypothetical protein
VEVDEPVRVVGIADDGVRETAGAGEYVGHRLILPGLVAGDLLA